MANEKMRSEDRIAELELQIEDANKRLEAVPALEQKVQQVQGELSKRDLEIVSLRKQLEAEKAKLADALETLGKGDKATVDLPQGAVQLSKSVKIPVKGGMGVEATAGDVLVTDEKTAGTLRSKLGTQAQVHTVSEDTIKEIRSIGAARS